MLKSHLIIFVLGMMLFSINCKEEQYNIPDIYVDLYIDLSLPEYSNLSITGNSIIIQGGYKGIILHRSQSDEFKAYEKTCTYDPECGQLTLEQSGYRAICSCCASEFSVTLEGSVQKKPAELSLKPYYVVYYQSTNQLHITN